MNIGAVVGLLQLGPGPGAPGPRRRCQEERTRQRGLASPVFNTFMKQWCQRGGFHLGQFLFTDLVKNSCPRLREV